MARPAYGVAGAIVAPLMFAITGVTGIAAGLDAAGSDAVGADGEELCASAVEGGKHYS
jgi:hypothetical protein